MADCELRFRSHPQGWYCMPCGFRQDDPAEYPNPKGAKRDHAKYLKAAEPKAAEPKKGKTDA